MAGLITKSVKPSTPLSRRDWKSYWASVELIPETIELLLPQCEGDQVVALVRDCAEIFLLLSFGIGESDSISL